MFFVSFYTSTFSLCEFTVKYTCDKDNGFTFKAYGTTAVKKVYAKGKEASCSTSVTTDTATNIRGFTANDGTQANPTVGAITHQTHDVTACGDEDVSWT